MITCPLCGTHIRDEVSVWGPLVSYVRDVLTPFLSLTRNHFKAQLQDTAIEAQAKENVAPAPAPDTARPLTTKEIVPPKPVINTRREPTRSPVKAQPPPRSAGRGNEAERRRVEASRRSNGAVQSGPPPPSVPTPMTMPEPPIPKSSAPVSAERMRITTAIPRPEVSATAVTTPVRKVENNDWVNDPLAEGLQSSPSPSPQKCPSVPTWDRKRSRDTEAVAVASEPTSTTAGHKCEEIPTKVEVPNTGAISIPQSSAAVPAVSPKIVAEKPRIRRRVIEISDTSVEIPKRRPSAGASPMGLHLRVLAVVNLKEVNGALPSTYAMLCVDMKQGRQLYVAVESEESGRRQITVEDSDDDVESEDFWAEDSLIGREISLTQYALKHLTQNKGGPLIYMAERIRFLSKYNVSAETSPLTERGRKRARCEGGVVREIVSERVSPPSRKVRKGSAGELLGRSTGPVRAYPGAAIQKLRRDSLVEVFEAAGFGEDEMKGGESGGKRRLSGIGSLLRPPSLDEESSSNDVGWEDIENMVEQVRSNVCSGTAAAGACEHQNCSCCRDWHTDLSQAMPPGAAGSTRAEVHHVRHRYIQNIAATPAGFWDVQFPPTQQQQQQQPHPQQHRHR